MKLKLIFFTALLTLSSSGFSQNLAVDTDFATNGMVSNPTVSIYDGVRAIAIQPDGKIVTLEGASQGIMYGIMLRRYNSDGSPDNGFGVNGIVSVQSIYQSRAKNALKIQNDGKIILCGYGSVMLEQLTDFAITRFNADGSLDTDFGTNGITINDFASGFDYGFAIAIQSDNKLVVAGQASEINGFSNFGAMRYNSNGTVDASFGVNGKVSIGFGMYNAVVPGSDAALAVKISPDGKIFLGGMTNVTSTVNYGRRFGVVRLNIDGSLDNNFGSGGKVITPFDGDEASIQSLIVTSDNKIIAVGNLDVDETVKKIILAKYDTTGNLDSSFGNNGQAVIQFNTIDQDDQVYDAILTADNKILAAGYTRSAANRDFLLLQVNLDGSLDENFDLDGYYAANLDTNFDIANTVMVQPDGKILCGGMSAPADEQNVTAQLVRFTQSVLTTQTPTTTSFTVSPNPFNDKLEVGFNIPQPEFLSFELNDIAGRKIKEFPSEQFIAGKNTVQLNMSETLPKGIYFLKITNGQNESIVKILK